MEQMKDRGDVVIKAMIEVKGSDLFVDLEGSSGQVDWGGNVVFNFTVDGLRVCHCGDLGHVLTPGRWPSLEKWMCCWCRWAAASL